VARCAGKTTVFVLRAFQNYLDAVAFTFLCHDAKLFIFQFRLDRKKENVEGN
jgi:hypothetical protein